MRLQAKPRIALRTPAFPADAIRPVLESADSARALHALLCERADMRETLRLASPSLGIAIDRWTANYEKDEGASVSAFAYLVRCCTRPTPFAACAAVGLLQTAGDGPPRVSGPLTRHTSPDSGWLYKIVHKYEADLRFIPKLRLRRSGLAHLFNGRLEVFDVARTHVQALAQRTAVLTVPTALNYTNAVQKALELCTPGIEAAALCDALAQALGVTYDAAFPLVAKLLEIGVFVSDLRVPPTGDPARALHQALGRIDPSGAEKLEKVLELLRCADAAPVEAAANILDAARRIAEELAEADHYWHIDSHRGYEGGLPEPLVNHIGAVLSKLASITLPDDANGALARAFADKYNDGREIPLLEVLDLEQGLRFEEILEKREDAAERRLREALLLEVAVTAIAEHREVIDLDEQLLLKLRVEHAAQDYPEHIEVICPIVRDAERGLRAAYVSGAFEGQHRSLARFHAILGGVDWEARGVVRNEITAELIALTHTRRSANVAMRPQARQYEVVAGIYGVQEPEHTISLDDIVVGVRGGRLYLRSKSRNLFLRVRENHMLNAEVSSRIARFFHVVCSSALPSVHFDWGTLVRRLPYSPGVDLEGVRVALRSWRMPKELVLDWSAEASTAWRARWRLPQRVYLAVKDNRLLLDLRRDICLAQLRRAAGRLPDGAAIELQEALPELGEAGIDGFDGSYFGEADITYRVLDHQSLAPSADFVPEHISREEYLRAPGSDWLYLKAYVARDRTSYFIEKRVAAFIEAAAGSADLVHFVRYADPEHHVRIRLRAKSRQTLPALYAHALQTSEHWVASGVVRRIAFDTYDREVERYGGRECIEIAERVFDVSSRIVLERLSQARTISENNPAILASVTAFAVGLCGGVEQARSLLKAVLGRRQQLSSEQWDLVRSMRTFSLAEDAALASLSGPASELRNRLAEPRFADVVRALLHMHCNRWGLSIAQEQNALHLSLALLEGWTARARSEAATGS